MIFSQRSINAIRRNVRKTLKQRCTIAVEAETVNAYGHPTHDLLTLYDNVPCRVIAVGRNFGNAGDIVGDQETLSETYRLITEHDTPLGVDMVVTVGGADYDVINVWRKQTDATDQQAVIVRRVKNGDV